MVVVDSDYRVQLWNGGAERLTGLRSFEAEGRRLLELELSLPAEPRARGPAPGGRARRQVPAPVDVELIDRFGQPQRRRLSVSPLLRGGSSVTGAVLTLSDTPADVAARRPLGLTVAGAPACVRDGGERVRTAPTPHGPRDLDEEEHVHQLTGLDAAFLAMETSAVYGHVGSICVLDPSTAPEPLTLERLQGLVALAAAPRPAVPPAAGRGALRLRPALLDRGPRLRHRVPRARAGAAGARRRPAAGRAGRPAARPPARPAAPAVGALPDLGAVRRTAGRLHEGPPRGDRRGVRQRHPGRRARPVPRGARARRRPALGVRRRAQPGGAARPQHDLAGRPAVARGPPRPPRSPRRCPGWR